MKRTLEITTVAVCPLKCSFCPQDKLADAYYHQMERRLRLEAFRDVANKLPLNVEIHFSGFVEPMINPDAVRMIRLARSGGRIVHLYTTLIGFLKDRQFDSFDEWERRDTHYRPDYIRVHVPDKAGLVYPDRKWIDFHEEFLETGWPASYMAMGELTPSVATYLHNVGIKVELPDMLSRGGNLWNPGRKEGAIVCSAERWHSNVMLPNGDVYLCCMDYSLSTRLGNLFHQPYSVIDDAAEKLRQASEPPAMCRTCEWSKQA